MKYTKIFAFLLTAGLLLTLCGCKSDPKPEEQEEPDPNFPVQLELVHETLTIQEAPSSVVSLSPAITTLFYDLGEDEFLKGVSSYALAEAAGKTDCGTAQFVDLEAVAAIGPDLLFTDTPLLEEQLTELYQMDVEVIWIPRPESEQEIQERAELVLLALYGREEGAKRADTFAEEWQKAWRPLEEVETSVAEEKNVLLLGREDLAATGDTWEGKLLEFLGMKNPAQEGSNWQVPEKQTAEDGTVSYVYDEDAVAWNPDVIFYDSRLSAEEIKAHQLYADSNAVANDALYPLDWSILQMQNRELPELLGSMVEKVYPELWEQIQEEWKTAQESEQNTEETEPAEPEAQAEAEKE